MFELDNIKITIPSKKEPIYSQPLTTPQLKQLIQSAVDTSVSGKSFYQAARGILRENLIDVDLKELTVKDRDAALYQYRRMNVDEEWKGKSLPDLDFTTFSGLIKQKELKVRGFTVILSTPSLDQDAKFSVDKKESLEQLVGELYLAEVSKYIISITYNEETIQLTTLPASDVLKVIEKLPPFVIHKVTKEMEAAQKQWGSFLSIDDETIVIDPEFFT